MKTRWKRLALLAPLLLLTGCFRPAGDAIPPTNDLAVVVPPTSEPSPDPLPLDAPTDAPVVPDAQPDAAGSSGDLPPITMLAPSSPTPIPTNAPVAAIEVVTQEVVPLPNAPVEVTAVTPFITPGSLLLPITPDTPAPGVVATSTPSGLTTPTDLPEAGTAGAQNASAAGGECVHVVESGDNLYRIALANDTTVAAMREANPELVGENPLLQVGQRLNLPGCAPTAGGSVQAGVTPTAATVFEGITPVAPAGGELYTVRPGDTLFRIAQQFGVTIAEIVEANELANPDRLDVGQQLVIPSGS